MPRDAQTISIVAEVPETLLEERLVEVFPASMRVVRHSNQRPNGSRFGNREAAESSLASISGVRPDAVFLVCSGDVFGHVYGLTAKVRQLAPAAGVLLATEGGSPDKVLDLLSGTIDDFVTSPFSPVDILPRLWLLLEKKRTADVPEVKSELSNLVGTSSRFLEVIDKIPFMARCNATVLIGGETGTGKEVCARAIHYLSPRANRPFVPVNCGAIPTELVENELFGHERAAFTGAVSPRAGLIHEAEGGTLFLDEVHCLPPTAQVKLLRFLQEKEYRPLGSSKTCSADVRLIAATNTDLDSAVRKGHLRQDFYFRINVLPLVLPPLRQRLQDIPLLTAHFLKKYANELRCSVPILLPEAERALLSYSWPGNVRELEHVIERAVVLDNGKRVISAPDIMLPGITQAKSDSFQKAKARAVSEFERSYIESLLLLHDGNITHAARVAGKHRRAFWELIRKHQIDTNRFRTSKTGTE